ncbi:hypothetical protein D3C72_2081830 [compost metagenome]
MPTVTMPIISKVMTSDFLRPIRSPTWPKTMPPTGRAKKPTAKVPNAAMVLNRLLSEGKNSAPNTRAAAVA